MLRFTVRQHLPIVLPALVVLVALGCAPAADDAAGRARTFWEAVAESRSELAREQVVAGDRDRQRRILEGLSARRVTIEDLAVPAEAEVAMLPTRLVRADPDSGAETALDTRTVLRRTDAGWRVDLDATTAEYRRAVAADVGDRLARAADRLGERLGRSAGDFGATLEALGELLERESERGARDLEAELGRRLEEAGEALARGLEELERALEDAQDAEPESPPEE